MARSTKAAPKSTTTKKRTTKRSTSKQRPCYEIPESPPSVGDSAEEDPTQQPSELAGHTIDNSSTSETVSIRGRSMSTTSSTLKNEDSDVTPTHAKPMRKRTMSVQPQQAGIPGLEALEAVNELYQKLEDTQNELDGLRLENKRLSLQEEKYRGQVENLQAEIKTEKDKVKKVQQAHHNEAAAADHSGKDRLDAVIASLRSFAPAALKIMPLLDVLTDAADIEYDDATEKLFQTLKDHKEQDSKASAAKAKKEPSH